MHYFRFIFILFIAITCFSHQSTAQLTFGGGQPTGGGQFTGAYGDYSNWNPPHVSNGNTATGEYSGYGSSGGFSNPVVGSPSTSVVGSVTSCEHVRTSTGNGISGGIAGFQGNAGGSFAGGGQSFSYNPSSHSFSYECAGVSINSTTTVDIAWPPFDIDVSDIEDPEEAKELRENWYQLSTRDPLRGRAGKNIPLFMNDYDICRMIDNTTSADEPLFVDVSRYEDWESVHGVAAGADPNGGFSNMANRASLPELKVCCSPAEITICDETMMTDYAEVYDPVTNPTDINMFSNSGGFATIRCASNNNFVAINVHGICGSTGSGSDPTPSGSGYSNPSNGGTISQGEYDSLSADVQDSLADAGYSATDQVGTNAVGAADISQAQAAADAEAAADAAKAQAEADRLAAEQAAQEAEEAANEDDDDDDDD